MYLNKNISSTQVQAFILQFYWQQKERNLFGTFNWNNESKAYGYIGVHLSKSPFFSYSSTVIESVEIKAWVSVIFVNDRQQSTKSMSKRKILHYFLG